MSASTSIGVSPTSLDFSAPESVILGVVGRGEGEETRREAAGGVGQINNIGEVHTVVHSGPAKAHVK